MVSTYACPFLYLSNSLSLCCSSSLSLSLCNISWLFLCSVRWCEKSSISFTCTVYLLKMATKTAQTSKQIKKRFIYAAVIFSFILRMYRPMIGEYKCHWKYSFTEIIIRRWICSSVIGHIRLSVKIKVNEYFQWHLYSPVTYLYILLEEKGLAERRRMKEWIRIFDLVLFCFLML